MSTNQALYRKTVTETLTYLDKPSEATRAHLAADGFLYDSKARQWFRSISDSAIVEETTQVA